MLGSSIHANNTWADLCKRKMDAYHDGLRYKGPLRNSNVARGFQKTIYRHRHIPSKLHDIFFKGRRQCFALSIDKPRYRHIDTTYQYTDIPTYRYTTDISTYILQDPWYFFQGSAAVLRTSIYYVSNIVC